jgi:hypothetical protein
MYPASEAELGDWPSRKNARPLCNDLTWTNGLVKDKMTSLVDKMPFAVE